MCEYCEQLKNESYPMPPTGAKIHSFPGSGAEETKKPSSSPDDLSTAGRDVLGFLRVSAKFGAVSQLSATQIKFVFFANGVGAEEARKINDFMKEEKLNQTVSPEDVLMDALMNAVNR